MAEQSRRKLFCGLQLNSLWSLWYCLLVCTVHIYLTYSAIRRYQKFDELPWQPGKRPSAELSSCLALVVLSLACLPAFVMCAMFKIGNYSSDGEKLGKELIKKQVKNGGKFDILKQIYKHLGPVAQTLHILSAFCLLLPVVLLQARAVGFTLDNLWGTDLDVIFGSSAANVGKFVNTTLLTPGGSKNEVPSVEFVNYITALLIYSVRYSSVFWFTHRGFTLLFSTQLFFAILLYIMSYCGFTVMYKLLTNQEILIDLSFVLSPAALLILYILGIGFIFMSSVTVFKYGYFYYNENFKLHQPSKREAEECRGYIPHIVAMATMVLAAVCKGPIIYDYVMVYRKMGHGLILGCIIFDAAYLVLWIVLWFALTLKQNWIFKFQHGKNAKIEVQLPNSQDNLGTLNTSNSQEDKLSKHDSTTEIKVVVMGTENPSFLTSNYADETPQSEISSVMTGEIYPSSVGGVLNQKIREKRRNSGAHQKSVTFQNTSASVSRETSYREAPKQQISIPVLVHKDDMQESECNIFARNNNITDELLQEESQSNAVRPNSLELKAESSPENTLKRNYRHSVRECDKYYHNRLSVSPPRSSSSSQESGAQYFYQGPKEGSEDTKYYGKNLHHENIELSKLPGTAQMYSNKSRNASVPHPIKVHIGNSYHGNKLPVKREIGRRDSANFSLTSSQETSSNDSDAGLCSQV